MNTTLNLHYFFCIIMPIMFMLFVTCSNMMRTFFRPTFIAIMCLVCGVIQIIGIHGYNVIINEATGALERCVLQPPAPTGKRTLLQTLWTNIDQKIEKVTVQREQLVYAIPTSMPIFLPPDGWMYEKRHIHTNVYVHYIYKDISVSNVSCVIDTRPIDI